MASKLSIYNDALIILEEGRELKSLSDDVRARYVLDKAWNNDFVKFILSRAAWRFAIRSVKLVYNPAYKIEFGYQYAFDLPNDFVLLDQISADEYFYNGLKDFEIVHDRRLMCNYETIYIRYVSSDTDIGAYSASFANYAAHELANRVCGSIGRGNTKKDSLFEKTRLALNTAKGDNNRNKDIEFPRRSNWVNAMRGN